ncbi:hypothetical protein K437DRAFT_81456 [Tilletiaria anomala UBC 951]|uniref:Uncharacterized protein n=1 Tax=Tilletiaria anomala (strain ATCC 24038 / CBS 436.72 / UBC 951) TaxID=1037660 RepID=A0A066W4L4_TILAU|nr:uncharacterized protein K437DRAFT_81456 [Tilletiaria anomala UBC 951]KDN48872.1 hypothetical protein K437DRAFT_81456 [Tilletiaria anomala UBC 951]
MPGGSEMSTRIAHHPAIWSASAGRQTSALTLLRVISISRCKAMRTMMPPRCSGIRRRSAFACRTSASRHTLCSLFLLHAQGLNPGLAQPGKVLCHRY